MLDGKRLRTIVLHNREVSGNTYMNSFRRVLGHKFSEEKKFRKLKWIIVNDLNFCVKNYKKIDRAITEVRYGVKI